MSFTYCSIEISPTSKSLTCNSPSTNVSFESMVRVPGEDLNSLTSPPVPSSTVALGERSLSPPEPLALEVPQNALASLYALGKSPAHFMISINPSAPTWSGKPASLSHASFFLSPAKSSMAVRCGACILAILHKYDPSEGGCLVVGALPPGKGFLVV